jgi:aryl-alcohol dehydrogenase
VFRDAAAMASIEAVEIADLRDDEVLVEVTATGICHTDLAFRDGFSPIARPAVLGHEGAGVVAAVGTGVSRVRPGDKVVLSFLACQHCRSCRSGMPSYCDSFWLANMTGRRPDGTTALRSGKGEVAGHFFSQSSLATYSVAHQDSVVKVRDDAPLEILGPLGCGVQTGAGSVINTLGAGRDEPIAVVGAGGVGLAAVMAAVVQECNPIVVVEPHPARRELALQLGAHHAVDPLATADLAGTLTKLSSGLQHAVDTSGNADAIGQTVAALAARATIVLLTGASPAMTLPTPVLELLGRGITVRGVSMGDSVPQEFVPYLVDLVIDGRLPISSMMRFYDLDDVNQAFADQHHGRAIKPIVRM